MQAGIRKFAWPNGLFHLMSIPPPPPTDEQPVTNLCKTSKPPGQHTIVVFDPWTVQYKNVLQSMYYSMNPWTNTVLRTPGVHLWGGGGSGHQME